MKFAKPGHNLVLAFLLCVGGAFSDYTVAGECGVETYASPTDYSSTYPLSKPSAEFSRMLAAAKRGNVLAQRNLAASFEGAILSANVLKRRPYGIGVPLRAATRSRKNGLRNKRV
jgi:hypothetical protein